MKFNLALLNACVVSACMLSTTPAFAAEKYEIAVVAKVTGIPWFNRMEVGVNDAAKKLDVNAAKQKLT
jgi:simple sugar transport system substrate-binding protein